jgi:hypothetical protein
VGTAEISGHSGFGLSYSCSAGDVTLLGHREMSAYDPKRKHVHMMSVSPPKADIRQRALERDFFV